jgi:hypothetical protein
MSANSGVTVLRSPSSASSAGCSDVTRIPGALSFAAEALEAMAGAPPVRPPQTQMGGVSNDLWGVSFG